jgi:hypothetical protein
MIDIVKFSDVPIGATFYNAYSETWVKSGPDHAIKMGESEEIEFLPADKVGIEGEYEDDYDDDSPIYDEDDEEFEKS